MLSIYKRTDLISDKVFSTGEQLSFDDKTFLLQFPKQYVDELTRRRELQTALSEIGEIIRNKEEVKGQHAFFILEILKEISD